MTPEVPPEMPQDTGPPTIPTVSEVSSILDHTRILSHREKQTDIVDDVQIAGFRPQRKNRRLPARYRDDLPQPPPPLPLGMSNICLLLLSPHISLDPPDSATIPISSATLTHSIRKRIRRVFRTARNIFGLIRLYDSTERPSHDPEQCLDIQDLCDGPIGDPGDPLSTQGDNAFHPYPNKNSFLLGDWYWNHGVQKSKESFQTLVSIVGAREFAPQDVRETKWTAINKELGSNDFDDDDDAHEWEDEDAGWRRKPITIDIPFHNRMRNPGTQRTVVFDLYHRSIVSVIKERLAIPTDDAKFHYEPYEYLWKPSEDSDEVRVHGESYTSATFHDAHRDLQSSPGEPGCDLSRVVVALMFSSDATHLTTFGNAKLWPCYLYFGNESKYRRCRPSSKLCNHIAYFQKVSP
jgi:hypothetical protein